MDERETVKQAASALAKRRRQVTRPCVVCGTVITGIVKQRYCSHRCYMQDWRKRQDGTKASPDA